MTTEYPKQLKINYLTQQQYDREKAAGRLNPNEFYLTPTMMDTVFADQLKHSLTIGPYVFDGSEDVTVPTYEGTSL